MPPRGRMIYVPPNLLEEAQIIMDSKGLKGRTQAFDEMVKYSQVGREAEKILKFDFNMFGTINKGKRKWQQGI